MTKQLMCIGLKELQTKELILQIKAMLFLRMMEKLHGLILAIKKERINF